MADTLAVSPLGLRELPPMRAWSLIPAGLREMAVTSVLDPVLILGPREDGQHPCARQVFPC